MKALLWLLPLTLAACMTVPDAATTSHGDAAAAVSATTLTHHQWQLQDAVDGSNQRLDALFGAPEKPLQLDCTAERIHVRNACNNISGSYRIVEGHLVTVQLLQTMMACADPTLMQRETTIKDVLRGTPTLILSSTDQIPLLTLAAPGGQTLTFAGVPTAEARYGSAGETVFLEVAAQTTPCQYPLSPRKTCLLARARDYDAHGRRSGPPGPWQPWPQDIEGYVHEAGTRNVLRVKRYQLKQPPAHAPATAYVLDIVVESEAVQGANSADLPQQP